MSGLRSEVSRESTGIQVWGQSHRCSLAGKLKAAGEELPALPPSGVDRHCAGEWRRAHKNPCGPRRYISRSYSCCSGASPVTVNLWVTPGSQFPANSVFHFISGFDFHEMRDDRFFSRDRREEGSWQQHRPHIAPTFCHRIKMHTFSFFYMLSSFAFFNSTYDTVVVSYSFITLLSLLIYEAFQLILIIQ